MMLLLATIYDVPELNIGFHFYLKSDEDEDERKRLKPPGNSGNINFTNGIKQKSILLLLAVFFKRQRQMVFSNFLMVCNNNLPQIDLI